MTGFFVMPRGWMDNALFPSVGRDPLCRKAAWVWLVEHAEFAPRDVNIEGHTRRLERGELSVSIRHLGGLWGWPTTKIVRFVSELNRCRFIGTRKIGRQIVISICDYEQFSFQKSPEDRSAETTLERSRNDLGTGKELIKEKEEVGSLRSPTARVAPSPKAFEAWYAEYPHKVGRGAAEKAYRTALARASPETMLAGLRRYIASKPPDRAWCNPSVWLNQQRWLDEPADNDGRSNGSRAKASAVDNLIEGFGRAAGLGRPSDREPDWEASGPFLDGEHARFDA